MKTIRRIKVLLHEFFSMNSGLLQLERRSGQQQTILWLLYGGSIKTKESIYLVKYYVFIYVESSRDVECSANILARLFYSTKINKI